MNSKIKLNWYICANSVDVVQIFAVIKNVAIKSFHCKCDLKEILFTYDN